ncbi:hypothetical protein Ciccas_001042 [Cichlidogyrus casuarinus]|uniref:Uncharacterized protein n=1 Tax=Cichlidogyrus casuarinus TaxID=1844966 RepID=A0ABD2QLF6_9PLAT
MKLAEIDIPIKADENLRASVSSLKLKKHIGLMSSVTIIVGTIIGSGIFISPTGVIKNANSLGAAIIIWIASGLFSLMGAYCYAELGTVITRSGADYAYFYEAFGEFAAFLRLYIEVVVVRPSTTAIVAITFANYALVPFYHGCAPPELANKLLAAASIMTVSFINCYSVKLTTRVQDLCMVAKMAALLAIIFCGFYNLAIGRTAEFDNMFQGTSNDFGALVNAFWSGLFSYTGWHYLNCLIDEMKNVKRDLPLAIIISCLVVTAIYTLAICAYGTVLTISETMTTTAIGISFAKKMFGPGWMVMPGFVALSCFGGMNGTIFTTSRLFYAGAQYNHMPKLCSMIHRTKLTPIPAVLVTCATSCLFLIAGDIYQIMNCLNFVQYSAFAIAVVSLLIFRVKRPNVKRVVKVPLPIPITYILCTVLLVFLSFKGSPVESLIGIGLVLTGVPIYMLAIYIKKPVSLERQLRRFTIWNQRVFDIVPSK